MKKLKDIIRFDNEWSEDVKNSNLEKLTGSIYMSLGVLELDFGLQQYQHPVPLKW